MTACPSVRAHAQAFRKKHAACPAATCLYRLARAPGSAFVRLGPLEYFGSPARPTGLPVRLTASRAAPSPRRARAGGLDAAKRDVAHREGPGGCRVGASLPRLSRAARQRLDQPVSEGAAIRLRRAKYSPQVTRSASPRLALVAAFRNGAGLALRRTGPGVRAAETKFGCGRPCRLVRRMGPEADASFASRPCRPMASKVGGVAHIVSKPPAVPCAG